MGYKHGRNSTPPAIFIFLHPFAPLATLIREQPFLMNSFLTLPCLASVDEYIPFFGMLIPITLFLVGLAITVASLYFKNQSRKMWHETARIALEKGQPIPAAPSDIEEAAPTKAASAKTDTHHSSGRCDFKAGLILLAVSAGLYFGFKDLNGAFHSMPTFVIYVPGFIGVALLINALITFLTTKKVQETPSIHQSPKA
jgi:hypothetical protein